MLIIRENVVVVVQLLATVSSYGTITMLTVGDNGFCLLIKKSCIFLLCTRKPYGTIIYTFQIIDIFFFLLLNHPVQNKMHR